MAYEAEMPGKKVSKERLKVICARYYFASPFISGKEVLEVGCGPGLGLGYLAKKAQRIVGMDISEENLRYARQRYKNNHSNKKIEILCLDAHNLSLFQNKSFDVVLAMATVYALDLNKFLRECRRLLKKNGLFIFDIPNKNVPGFKGSKFGHKYYSVPELFRLLEQYQFDSRIFGAFPIARGFASGVRERIRVTLLRIVSNILEAMPGGRIMKDFLDGFTLDKIKIMPEIEEKDIEVLNIKNIKFVPLPRESPNFNYKILYVIAKAS